MAVQFTSMAKASSFGKSLPVTLPEIKRIEVLKGPASVVYGFNAFDGVINIITKSAQELKGTTLQFGGGELGTLSSAAIHAGTVGQLDYRLSAGRDQNQQWRDRDALAFRSHKFNAQTQYNFSNDGILRVAGGFIDTNRFDGPVSNLQISHSQFNQGFSDIHTSTITFPSAAGGKATTFLLTPPLTRFLHDSSDRRMRN